jgi:hypothetical protein
MPTTPPTPQRLATANAYLAHHNRRLRLEVDAANAEITALRAQLRDLQRATTRTPPPSYTAATPAADPLEARRLAQRGGRQLYQRQPQASKPRKPRLTTQPTQPDTPHAHGSARLTAILAYLRSHPASTAADIVAGTSLPDGVVRDILKNHPRRIARRRSFNRRSTRRGAPPLVYTVIEATP